MAETGGKIKPGGAKADEGRAVARRRKVTQSSRLPRDFPGPAPGEAEPSTWLRTGGSFIGFTSPRAKNVRGCLRRMFPMFALAMGCGQPALSEMRVTRQASRRSRCRAGFRERSGGARVTPSWREAGTSARPGGAAGSSSRFSNKGESLPFRSIRKGRPQRRGCRKVFFSARAQGAEKEEESPPSTASLRKFQFPRRQKKAVPSTPTCARRRVLRFVP